MDSTLFDLIILIAVLLFVIWGFVYCIKERLLRPGHPVDLSPEDRSSIRSPSVLPTPRAPAAAVIAVAICTLLLGCGGGSSGGGAAAGGPGGGSSAHPDPNFSLRWDGRYGTAASELVADVVAAGGGGFVVLSSVDSDANGDKTENGRGKADYWLLALDDDGIPQWDATYGGDDDDFARALIATADGGYLVLGESASGISGDRSQANRGVFDIWIVKLAADGSKQWDRRYGGSGTEYAEDVIQTADGGYLIVGSTSSPLDGEVSDAGEGKYDVWLLKLDAAGEVDWDQRYGGSENEFGLGVVARVGGGYHVLADTWSDASGDVSVTTHGLSDYWLLRLTADGSLAAEQRIGGDHYELGEAIVATADGGCIIAGSSRSGDTITRTVPGYGLWDYWVVRIDGDDAIVWDAAFGGDAADNLSSMVAGEDGTLVLTGISLSGATGSKDETSRGVTDYWVVRIALDDGSELWNKRFGGSNSEEENAILALADGSYLVAGMCASPADGDVSDGYIGPGSYDLWVVRFDDGPWTPPNPL